MVFPYPQFNSLGRFSVGLEDTFKRLFDFQEQACKTLTNWPPYNIRKAEDNKYVIEMAVAGFDKQDIDITLDGDKLIVASNIQTEETSGSDKDYLYHGIAKRAFARQFTLADNIVINNASLVNGMLKIWLEAITEAKKLRKIDIQTEENNSSGPQFLQEDDLNV